MTMTLRSSAFTDGGAIPVRHSCDGEDVSPPLAWDGVPEDAVALALVVDDPDAGGFVHWVLADIPGEQRELPEGEGDGIGAPGRTGFGREGWAGPCPPSGEHRYVFTLYALSEATDLGAGATAEQLRAAIEGRVLAEGRLTGVYSR